MDAMGSQKDFGDIMRKQDSLKNMWMLENIGIKKKRGRTVYDGLSQ